MRSLLCQGIEHAPYFRVSNKGGIIERFSTNADGFALRSLLRAGTRVWHDRVEEAFERFDLESSGGSRLAVDVHVSVMSQALKVMENHPLYASEIRRLLALAEPTLRPSHLADKGGLAPADSDLHPLSFAYVILGSRLGTRVITRRIEAGKDSLAPHVYAFLSDGRSGECWRQLCRELDSVTSADEQRTILADANSAFAIYHETALAILPAPTKDAA